MHSPGGKILVIRGGAIGDFILTLPAIAALRRQFPQAHLEVLGYPHIVQLAIAGELVDRVQSIEARALAGFFARNGELQSDLADYFSEFDLMVSYLFDPDEIFRVNVARCSTAQFIVGPHRPNEREKTHATRVYLKPLERLAIFEADAVPRLSVLSADEPPASDSANAAGNGFTLAVHPGSGSEKKNWPETKWKELLRAAVDKTSFNLLLVGGEAEAQRIEQFSALLPKDRMCIAKNLPLRELAARLATCVGFVGHDSGITHLAAAVGLPALVLWPDTNEHIWRPLGQNVAVLRGPGRLADLEVETVFAQIEALQADKRFEQEQPSNAQWSSDPAR